MRKIPILFFFAFSFFFGNAQKYQATYKVEYIPKLSNGNKIARERTILQIEAGKESIYASENAFKMDSIMRLVKEKGISPYEFMNEKTPKTMLFHFVRKNFVDNSMKVSNLFMTERFIYTDKKEILWVLEPDTLRINNYLCHKAVTNFEGRVFTAWYAPEIPIQDGPYKFWGLPGLILSVYDSEKHYVFSLLSFEKTEKKTYDEPFQSYKTFEVGYDKYQTRVKEYNQNPMRMISSSNTAYANGKEINIEQMMSQIKLNPIERY